MSRSPSAAVPPESAVADAAVSDQEDAAVSDQVLRRRAGDLDFEFAAHHCFACGELNERGLRLQLHLAEGRCWTELTLGSDFEGWEGIVHGGILTTILDEVMAWALVATDAWGLTARITTDFRRPVRVGQRIRAEGWLTRNRRRLIDTEARIVDVDSGELLAGAKGLYVAAPPDQRALLKKRYRFRLVEPAG
jgi:acyl-coenzyme A thioesterase PaaI-like protein